MSIEYRLLIIHRIINQRREIRREKWKAKYSQKQEKEV